MAETPKPKKKGGPGKKIGPLTTLQWSLVGAGTFGVYYIYKKHAANVAAANGTTTTASTGIDPNTGLPYSSETGANAIDPTTGVPYSQELAQSTGSTSGTGLSATDPATGLTYLQEAQNLASYGNVLGLTSGTTSTTATTGTSATGTLTASGFTSGLQSQLLAAYGPGTKANLSAATITDQLNNYLNGRGVTNSTLVQGINNIISPNNGLGAAAIATGGLIKPVISAVPVTTVTHTATETPVQVAAPKTTTTTAAKTTTTAKPATTTKAPTIQGLTAVQNLVSGAAKATPVQVKNTTTKSPNSLSTTQVKTIATVPVIGPVLALLGL